MQAALRKAGAEQRSESDWSCPLKDNHTNDDQSASLTVRYGDKEPSKVILACAKCGGADEFLPVLGLEPRDLVDRPKDEVRRYVYCDEAGVPLFRVVKLPGTNGKSRTYQERADGHGGWFGGAGAMQGVRRPLYRLDEVLEAVGEGRTIHITEGESDADALNGWFIKHRVNAWATCHPGGAGKWRPEHTATLAGAARVVVWADRDAPGYACAHQRLAAVLAAGLRAEARVPIEGKDVRDHLAAGHAPHEGKRVKKKALAQLAGAGAEPAGAAEDEQDDGALLREIDRLRTHRDALRILRAEEAAVGFEPLPRQTLKEALANRPEEPAELIERLHRRGYNTTITAQYKTGKTTLGGNLLRSLADGTPFLGRFSVQPPVGRIGLLNYELTDSDMLGWLDDQGIESADRIAILNLRGKPFSLAHEQGREELVAWCQEMAVEVLFLDPHRRAFAGFGEENSNDHVNLFAAALDEVKARAGVPDLFLFVHTGRDNGTPGAERARGATALDDWADQRWVLTKGQNGVRFFHSTSGRMPDVEEFALNYDPATRHLTAGTGNRSNQKHEQFRKGVLAALDAAGSDGANTAKLEAVLDSRKGELAKVLGDMHGRGEVAMELGPRNEKRYWLPEHAPENQR
ncbi:hypothetical protein DQ237_11385 [Blastococcus sp. TF02-8]|uniref:AAA family ATPase n=1 Tax=Blastococcus sp. TF02-8 TaxID=2250574 RepID=UPI000DE97411|nr:AAA family ATPase [Blastococcus sp. TF02-8]RBY95756.1 hypothetical protein DQ237_11385 [Blastococcus sp. TF02-8]